MHGQFTRYLSGTLSKLYTSLPVVITKIVTRNIPTKFIFHPAFTNPRKGTFPDPNTTAFVGVAIGSINAMEAASAVGVASSIGWSWFSSTNDINTGSKILVVAVLLVISVKNATNVEIKRTSQNCGRVARGFKNWLSILSFLSL